MNLYRRERRSKDKTKMAETSPGDDVMELELEDGPPSTDTVADADKPQGAVTNGNGLKNNDDSANGEEQIFTGSMTFDENAPELQAGRS